MNKLLKYVGLGLGVVLLLLAATVLAVVLLVDPNDYRDDITNAVQQATGRELKIEGDLGLSLFPWLGLSLGETSLSNAPGFGEQAFAQVAGVDIKLKLLPLLQRRVEMKTLRLRGLQLNLSRAADGKTNWDDLMAAPGEATPAEAPTGDKPVAAAAMPLTALAIGGLDIEDARIRWHDAQAGQQVDVNQFNLRTGPIELGAPIDLDLSTQLSLSQPKMQTPLKLQGRLTLDPKAQRYGLDGLLLTLNLSSDLLPVSPLNARLRTNIVADLQQQELQLSKLTVEALELNTQGDIKVQQLLTAPLAEGQLSVASFSPRDLTKTLGITLPPTADAKVLSKASLKLAFSGSAQAVKVEQLQLVLDDSHLNGSLQARNFAQPALRYDLQLDAIDVDRYLPPATTAPPPSPAGAAVASTQLPLDMLRGLDVKGDLRVGQLKVAKARLADIVLGLTAKGGRIEMFPAQAKLYQGEYNGHIGLDVRQDVPRLSADEKVTAVQVGPMLKDVLGDDKVSGTATVAAKVSAKGATPDAITQSLNGTANFHFRDGAVKGVNLGQLIREAYAKLKKRPPPPKTTNETDFAELSGSVKIINGVVHNDDLQAKSPLLRAGGKGQVNLPQQKINYLVNASIVESNEGQAGKELAELKSLTIPVKVTGTFSKPKFALDLAPVLKAKAKAAVQKEKAKLKQEAKEKLEQKKAKAKKKLEDKLKNKLKSLF